MAQESSTSALNMILPKVVKDFSEFAGFQNGAEKLLSGDSGSVSTANCAVLAQEIIGSARKISCQLYPSMGKAWLSYASWCFTHANHSLSGTDSNVQNNVSSILQSELSPDRFHLTDNEKFEMEQRIRSFYVDKSANCADHNSPATKGCSYSSEQEYPMTTLIEHVTHLLETAAGAPGFEASDAEGAYALLSSELTVLFHKYDSAKGNAMPLVSNLIEIWWSLRQRRVSLFGHAANAYFQYLSYSSTELQPSYHRDALKGKTRGYTLRALLYLLHIILNYGVELKQTLESGLSTVPLLPWQVNHDSGICSIIMIRLMYNYMFGSVQEIIPQLFARLSSHPEKIVRKQLESILVKLGNLSPYSIVYPTLVDINACEGEPSEELQRILNFLVCLVDTYTMATCFRL